MPHRGTASLDPRNLNRRDSALRSSLVSVEFTSDETSATATSIRMTVTVVVVLPVMMIYPFFQRFFTKGIMIGAVKG